MYLRIAPSLYLVWLGLVAWALCGCGNYPSPVALPPFPEVPVVPAAAATSLLAGKDGLLLIRDEAGNLRIIDRHGQSQQTLTDDASARIQYAQPTWSPSGAWIAWVRTAQAADAVQGTLEVASPAGEVRWRQEMPFPPFYLYWNNDSTRLSFLSNWRADNRWTLGLHVLELDPREDAPALQLAGTGQPFYYVWSPSDARLLIHQSLDHVYLQQDAEVTRLTDTAAAFGAPQWSPDGQFVLYGDTQDGVAVLRQDFPATGEIRTISYFQGKHLALFLNPTGKRLAVTETPQQWSVNSLGPLYLYDLEGRTFQEVTSEPVIAAFWSPDGARLLFYAVERQTRVPTLRLWLWEDETVRDLGTIVPPPLFLQRYLPFSDQYALSHRLWSPDSRHIAFVTQEPNGRNAIYVQDVTADAAPVFLAHGDLAFWSHQ